MKRIAIIPARGGRERIPNKNLMMIRGETLVSIAANKGLRSDANTTILSTDSERIIEACPNDSIALHHRPSQYCGSKERFSRCILEDMIPKYNIKPEDIITLIQPTYPFVTVESLNWSMKVYYNSNKYVSAQTVSLVPERFHPHNSRWCRSTGTIGFEHPGYKRLTWSAQSDRYVFSGAVSCLAGAFNNTLAPFSEPSACKIVDLMEGHDIDTYEDLYIARAWAYFMEGPE